MHTEGYLCMGNRQKGENSIYAFLNHEKMNDIK